MNYQKLYDYLSINHDAHLLINELKEVIDICKEITEQEKLLKSHCGAQFSHIKCNGNCSTCVAYIQSATDFNYNNNVTEWKNQI
jgi:hypothetical protein